MFFVLLGILVCRQVQAQTPTSTEQDIIKLAQTWTDAYLKKDRATVERILADDFVYTHSNGSVSNKTQYLAEMMSADTRLASGVDSELKVRIFGDVAILTGIATIQGTAKGYVPGLRRFTDIFLKRNGRWQCIGGQSTLLPAKQ
jgi:ketosteroid isomerase-like protein